MSPANDALVSDMLITEMMRAEESSTRLRCVPNRETYAQGKYKKIVKFKSFWFFFTKITENNGISVIFRYFRFFRYF